jgi:hypothetical protein
MMFSRVGRRAAMALGFAALLAATIGLGPTARAAGSAPSLKPIVLVVDSHVKASGLTQADALKRASAVAPVTVTAPTFVPAGSALFAVSVERPIYQTTRGTATLSFGSMQKGVTFQIDEKPVPVYYALAKVVPVTINGIPAIVYELGSVGKNQLVALTWSIGNKRFFDLTSNIGKSGLSESTMVKIAASVH